MALSDNYGSNRQPRGGHPQRQSNAGQRAARGGQGRQGQRPRQGSQQGRPLRGNRSTGYSLHEHNIRFQGKGGVGSIGGYDPRAIALLAGGVLVLILLIVGISSCVRGCSAQKASSETVQAEGQDSRIASGVSDNMKTELTTALDTNAKLSEIAENADKYSDEAIIQLALDEPDAIDFVSQVPSAEKKASPYEDAVTKDTIPSLVNWDKRWGFVSYASLPLGVSGSGPTCMSMAYMGLTGKNDKSPADMATLSTNDGYASGEAYTKEEFFTKEAAGLGLYCESPAVSAEEIVGSLQNSHPVICLVKANTLTTKAHYVIVAKVNSDGTLVVYDPTSTSVSAHPWAPATIAGYAEKIFVLHVAQNQATSDDAATDEASATEAATDEAAATEAATTTE